MWPRSAPSAPQAAPVTSTPVSTASSPDRSSPAIVPAIRPDRGDYRSADDRRTGPSNDPHPSPCRRPASRTGRPARLATRCALVSSPTHSPAARNPTRSCGRPVTETMRLWRSTAATHHWSETPSSASICPAGDQRRHQVSESSCRTQRSGRRWPPEPAPPTTPTGWPSASGARPSSIIRCLPGDDP